MSSPSLDSKANPYVLFVGFSLAVLLLGPISGIWLLDVIRGLFVIHLGLCLFPQSRSQLFGAVHEISEKIGKKTVLAYMGLMIFLFLANWCTRYFSLGPKMWDEGQFFQLTHNFVYHDKATVSFRPQGSYLDRHLSLSIWLVAILYRLFDSPLVVELYQGVISLVPAVLLTVWAYLATKNSDQQTKRPWLFCALVFSLYFYSPNFVSQDHGSYAFHILGPTFLAAAAMAYYFKRPALWVLFLSLLCFEKEEFAFVSLVFIGVAWVDHFVLKRQKFGFWAFCVAPFVFISLYYISKGSNAESRELFANAFGNIGASPKDAVKNIFTQPQIFIDSFFNSVSLKYFLFYPFFSLIWLKPRWDSAKYFLLAGILLMLNSLAKQSPPANMYQDIGAHYSILINLGACLVILTGCLNIEKWKKPQTPVLVLLAVIGSSSFFVDRMLGSELAGNLDTLAKNREDRQLINQYAENKSEVREILCCSEEYCPSMAARRWGYFANDCFENPSFSERTLRSDLPLRFIVTTQSSFYTRLSRMAKVEKQTSTLAVFEQITPTDFKKFLGKSQ